MPRFVFGEAVKIQGRMASVAGDLKIWRGSSALLLHAQHAVSPYSDEVRQADVESSGAGV
ncbi:hypothetical protein ACNKHL_13885 [Shigella flexneri]